jgi:hypothetical protein
MSFWSGRRSIWEKIGQVENVHENSKGKDKAIPLQASTSPERSSRLRLPDFMTIGA